MQQRMSPPNQGVETPALSIGRLSRWVSVPALPVRAVAVFSPCDQDDSLPFKAVVRQAQQKALATDGTEVKSFGSAVGLAVLDDEGSFRIHACGRHVLWILDSDKQLQVRLIFVRTCATQVIVV